MESYFYYYCPCDGQYYKVQGIFWPASFKSNKARNTLARSWRPFISVPPQLPNTGSANWTYRSTHRLRTSPAKILVNIAAAGASWHSHAEDSMSLLVYNKNNDLFVKSFIALLLCGLNKARLSSLLAVLPLVTSMMSIAKAECEVVNFQRPQQHMKNVSANNNHMSHLTFSAHHVLRKKTWDCCTAQKTFKYFCYQISLH